MGPPSERGNASDLLRSRSRERLREEPPRDRERRDRRLVVGEAERRRARELERERGDRDRLRRYGGEKLRKLSVLKSYGVIMMKTHVAIAPFALLGLPVIATATTPSASDCENRLGEKIVCQ